MINFLNEFKNLKAVLVNHGEIDVKDNFAKRIAEHVKVKNVAVLDRSYFFRVGPYGITNQYQQNLYKGSA